MRNVVLGAVCGLASVAAAQSASLSIVASQSYIDTTVTDTMILDVYADSSIGTHITGAAFTLSAMGGAGFIESMSVLSVPSWGQLGFDDFGDGGDGNYNGLIMGQIVFLPFIQPDPASALGNGPVLLASFSVTFVTNMYSMVGWTVGGGLGTFVLEVIDVDANPDGNPPGEVTQIANPEYGSMDLNIIPAPSGLAVLGLGGLVAGRRRR